MGRGSDQGQNVPGQFDRILRSLVGRPGALELRRPAGRPPETPSTKLHSQPHRDSQILIWKLGRVVSPEECHSTERMLLSHCWNMRSRFWIGYNGFGRFGLETAERETVP